MGEELKGALDLAGAEAAPTEGAGEVIAAAPPHEIAEYAANRVGRTDDKIVAGYEAVEVAVVDVAVVAPEGPQPVEVAVEGLLGGTSFVQGLLVGFGDVDGASDAIPRLLDVAVQPAWFGGVGVVGSSVGGELVAEEIDGGMKGG